MNRRELVLKKLHELPDSEVIESIKQLTHHVQARLRFHSLLDRTKTGAHGEKNLGMNAIDYYVGESIKRLYDPKGWDWKFEKLSLAEQLMRIANKLISDKVADYKAKREDIPVFDERDSSDIPDLVQIACENLIGNEEIYTRLIQLALEISNDDDNLNYFTLRYFENVGFPKIAEEMELTIEQVYALRKKLVRRLMNYKKELTA